MTKKNAITSSKRRFGRIIEGELISRESIFILLNRVILKEWNFDG